MIHRICLVLCCIILSTGMVRIMHCVVGWGGVYDGYEDEDEDDGWWIVLRTGLFRL